MWDDWVIQSKLINYESLFLAKTPQNHFRLFFGRGTQMCGPWENIARCLLSYLWRSVFRAWMSLVCVWTFQDIGDVALSGMWSDGAQIPNINLYEHLIQRATQISLKCLLIHRHLRHLTLSIKLELKQPGSTSEALIELNLNKERDASSFNNNLLPFTSSECKYAISVTARQRLFSRNLHSSMRN